MTPEPPIRPRTRRRIALTVRGWQALVLSIMGVMVLAGTVAGAVLLNRTDGVSRELSDNIEPARVAAFQLQSALRDQESGIRGYVISSGSQFLSPYYDGRRTEEAAAQNIRRLLGRRGDLLADLDAIEKAARAWRAS